MRDSFEETRPPAGAMDSPAGAMVLWCILGAAAIALATGAVVARGAEAPGAGSPPAAAAVTQVEVEQCVVRYAEEVAVPALDSGPLVEVAVKQNQEVQSGQLVARLADDSLGIRRRAAELRRKIAQQRLADNLEGDFAETAYQEAVEELESNRRVYDASSGAVPLTTLRRLRLAVERANLERERVKKLRREAEIELEVQTAELELIDDHLRRLRVQSPMTGVVLSVEHQVGEWVAVGDPVARVARMDRLHVQALLSESQLLPRLAQDAPVTVRWREGEVEHVLRGRVTSVDPQMLSGGRYRLHATVENRLVQGSWLLWPGREVAMTVHPVATGVTTHAARRTSSAGATR